MMAEASSGAFVRRVINLWRTEGFRGFRDRLKSRLGPPFARLHLLVMRLKTAPVRAAAEGAPASCFGPDVLENIRRADRLFGALQFKRVTPADTWEIDELTRLDPWRTPRSVTLEKLAEGWICYVALREGKVAANWWSKVGGSFYDPVLDCTFTLAPHEVYHYRTFCVPEYRNKAVVPRLAVHILDDLAQREGAYVHVGFVRPENEAQRRTLQQMGFSVAGRVGFIEALRVRVNYLLGEEVLLATRKRLHVHMRHSSG
jgi:ribosomal protein S18 acetylase RimI-like enzyme